MHRVTAVKPAGQWNVSAAADRVVLDAGDRNRRRIVLKAERGTELMLEFGKPVSLRDGDGLALDDGSIVLVAGAPEALVEVAAHSALDTVRLAWHLGNRHTDVQIAGERLRIRRDHVLEEMLRGLGAALTPLEAAFDPEAAAPHGHERG
ncbi:MAG TPA: urease accessory protein UreE [Pseudolabrys sp.]|jgi:urease accessory protein|nr:urease accessory protein UreE [Pseudolabrys sp.]